MMIPRSCWKPKLLFRADNEQESLEVLRSVSRMTAVECVACSRDRLPRIVLSIIVDNG